MFWFLILWIGFSIFVAAFARSRGRNALRWGLYSVLCCPFIAVVCLLLAQNFASPDD
jgi:hypothetical protein